MNHRVADILFALEFADPESLPVEVGPGTVQATEEGKVYTLEIGPDDPLHDLVKPGACEVCCAAEATIKGAVAWVCAGCSTWADFSGPPGD